MEVSVVNFVCSTVKQSNRQEQGTNVKTGDNELIKQINYGIILDTIRESGPISRIDISRKTGLSRSTCSIICESMLSQNLLIETGKSMSSGGRKPVLLELNANAGIVISLKLMEGVIVGALVNLGGKVLSKKHIIVPRNLEPDQYIESLKQYIDATLKAVTGPDTVGPDTVGPDILSARILSARILSARILRARILSARILPARILPTGKRLAGYRRRCSASASA